MDPSKRNPLTSTGASRLRRKLAAWSAILLGALAGACASPPPIALAGRAQIIQHNSTTAVHASQLSRTAERLTQAAARRGLNRPWVFIPTDSRVPNAAAICADDGEAIIVSDALFEITQTDAGLAAALAHEMGHLALGHGPERRKEQARTGPDSPAFRALARGHELEADEWGFRLMREAGYNPREMIAVWQRYDEWQQSAGGPKHTGESSPHPSWEQRIERLERIRRR